MLETIVNLPHDHECDIKLVFPNGTIATVQYRLEAPSIDLCFAKELSVSNWQGDDMEPADAFEPHLHIRMAKQLAIIFDPNWLEPKI